MTLLAVLMAAAAGAVLAGRDGAATDRLAQLVSEPRARARPSLGPRAACVLAGVGLALLGGFGVLGVSAGLAVGVAGPRLLGRLEPQAARREREALARDVPLALDLLAACLAGGAAMPHAVAAVAGAVGGPCGRRLLAVQAALSVGSSPREAWAALAPADEPFAAAGRALARAAEGGAPVVATVARLAAEARADARARHEQAARRVGVLVVAPLGLCFLPAFVLLGVVPVVAGLAGPVLSGL